MVSMNIKPEPGELETSAEYDPSPVLYLNDDQVEALGIKGVPAPGVVFSLRCRAVVTGVRAEGEEPGEGEGDAPDVSLTLRITDMEATRSEASATSVLYGKD